MAKDKRVVKTLRVPSDMAALITREAKAQNVPENTWMLAVLAGAVGYRKPDEK